MHLKPRVLVLLVCLDQFIVIDKKVFATEILDAYQMVLKAVSLVRCSPSKYTVLMSTDANLGNIRPRGPMGKSHKKRKTLGKTTMKMTDNSLIVNFGLFTFFRHCIPVSKRAFVHNEGIINTNTSSKIQKVFGDH